MDPWDVARTSPNREDRPMSTPTPTAPRVHPAARIGRAAALLVGLVAFGFTVWLVAIAEPAWGTTNVPQPTPEQAFVNGSIGTELAPLAAFEVLPDLFPAEFHPFDTRQGLPPGTSGDWIDQYGFIRKNLVPKKLDDGSPLPVGFVLSNHRPGSGAPSPVPFVGLSCAACHSAEIRTDAAKPGVLVYGVGNPTMNLLAFSEAVRGVLVKRVTPTDKKSEYVLTVDAVRTARAAKNLPPLTFYESLMTRLWIGGARGETADYQRVVDDPLSPELLYDPKWMPAGPARTQPFRSLVRVHLDRPGMSGNGLQPDQGFSKIPVVYHQAHDFHGKWAQFDGSVSNIVARSTLAASTAGANVNNLSLPDLSANIISAAKYTEDLGPPTWKTVFGTDLDKEQVTAGRSVYLNHCFGCHGEPDGKGGWAWGANTAFGQITPWKKIGTDPERVQFRHVAEIPQRVYDEFVTDFRKDHPLGKFKLDELAARTGDAAGYYNGPIAGAFLRAPYLHNASVLTLAELVGREPRRAKFYRGRNPYDLKWGGFQSPDVPAGVDAANPVPKDKD